MCQLRYDRRAFTFVGYQGFIDIVADFERFTIVFKAWVEAYRVGTSTEDQGVIGFYFTPAGGE